MKHQYHIYQLDSNNTNVINKRKMFMDWRILEKFCGGFDIKEYNKVYDGEIESDKHDMIILDMLFEEFNLRHPSDFKGHSMSVSDVVVLDGTMYFCDGMGWRKV